jgi:hypothetical protein
VKNSRSHLYYGYIVECTVCDKDENGKVIAVHCNYFPDSKSGTEGANNYKVKGTIPWVSAFTVRRQISVSPLLYLGKTRQRLTKNFKHLTAPATHFARASKNVKNRNRVEDDGKAREPLTVRRKFKYVHGLECDDPTIFQDPRMVEMQADGWHII